ncbi:pericentriolar material 1 protein [Rhincodon typus]|uniref:pericentriolar material 1 protein n=1 Tax=Rhincodon typus TaxID=259920 RepID=UPI00202E377A|nr:pericentriolar material 1 protein [Rhincodon typus]
MATGGDPLFEENIEDHNCAVNNGSLDDQLNNRDWSLQYKKANGSSEKNKKKLSAGSESRVTNDISPESSPGVGRRRAKTPKSYPPTKHASRFCVPDSAELERLKQRINFSDLDERSIGSDSHGRATAANNQRPPVENRKPFNFLQQQINSNKSKELDVNPQRREAKLPTSRMDLFASISKDLLPSDQVSLRDDQGESEIESSQVVSRLIQIRDYISKAHSMRDDLMEKNERSANVERLSELIDHLKEQEKSYMKFLQKMLARENEEDDVGTTDSAVGSGSVADSTSLNLDVQSEASDATEASRSLSVRPCIEDKLGNAASQAQGSSVTSTPKRETDRLGLKDRRVWHSGINGKEHGISCKVWTERTCTALCLFQLKPKVVCSSAPAVPCSSHKSDQRSCLSAPAEAGAAINREPSSLASSACVLDSMPPQHENDAQDNPNPRKKLKKLKEVHKRLNELRELIDYYQQTSDMMTDAVNEHTKDDDNETEEESLYYSDQGNPETITNIRNPQRSNWTDISGSSRMVPQNGTSCRNGRLLNTECEINNRPTNLQTSKVPLPSDEPHVSYVECSRFNDERDEDRNGDTTQEQEVQGECASEGTISSRRSSFVEETDQDFEIQQKINRLNAAKQKLRQLQELVAMVQEVPDATDIDISNFPDFSLIEEDQHRQQPNNTRTNASRSSKEVSLDEEKREKFYEAKLQQQQQELKQLQEERKRLMEIQEKIRHLQSSCPDLQLSTSSAGNLSKIKVPIVTSTPAISGQSATAKTLPDPVAAPPPDSELWSEMRRHQILREELRQRRKQLEALMAEHQRQKTLTENNSIVAASVKSEGTETQDTQQLSRTERTMATWGGSTQGALDDDEEDDDDDDDEEEENNDAGDEEENDERSDAIAHSEVETSSHETYTLYPNQERSQATRNSRESKKRWKDKRTCSSDGNYRSFHKNKQHNVGMRRQENLRWAADLSYVEEREHWQEQVNQLTRQLEFSTNMCQTLMQDQQALSCLLQTFLTGPYSVMPSNVGSPQVHIIMHQLNQCYTQLAWQQNHVQRLKQMLNDLLHQQHQDKKPENQRDSGVPPPSPNSFVFPPFSFPSPSLNPLSMSRFPNCSPFVHGFNLNPIFPPGLSDLSQNVSVQSNEQQPVVSEHSISGKTEYLAFPKPFESNSPKYRENKWIHKRAKDEAEQSELMWLHDTRDEFGELPRQMQPNTSLPQMNMNKPKQQVQCKNRKNFEESSLESFSSMPDPVDPTTVTKTFKSRKACAQASLASKDKTPKGKCKKTYFHQKNQQEMTAGFESASNTSASETCQEKVCHSTQTEEFLKPRTCSTTKDELQEKSKRKKSSDFSSEYTKGALLESNRNRFNEAPETGSDFSLFEALRDNIYSEVATLISQNESRPHFLIELFHELQLLNTDYLRQRALYALQDIVTRHLSDKSYKEGEHTLSQNSAVWMTCNSELTPSESLATSDDEDACGKTADHQAKIDLQQHEDAEYIESLENASMLSTSSNLEPFANDDLGNTVIHLDKALSRMREYERMKFEVENSQIDVCASAVECVKDGYNAGNSCTADHVSDASNVTCPRVDTQQLDKQIKAIMTEVIPFLKEHMDDVCSPQLLSTIGCMVLTLTQQNDESKEFVKFFHDQLGAILQDSLAKFAGRKLKECGEDLLVEISEILFNELAFFRLMQDLDNSSVAAKQRCKRLKEVASFKPRYTTEEKQHSKENGSSAEELEDEDKDKDESETVNADGLKVNESTEAELVLKSALSDREEDDVDSEVLPAKCVSISLSKAETQALTNYGSGEDENEEDEIEDFDSGAIDVQTSLQANNEIADENDPEQDTRPEPNKDDVTSQSMKTNLTVVAENESSPNPDLPNESFQHNPLDAANEDKKCPKPSLAFCENANAGTAVQMEQENDLQGTPESSLAGSPDTDSPVLVNDYQEAGSGNLSQKSDEDDFVKVENVPPSLSVLSEDELVRRISEEEQHNNLACVLLNADGAQELAGNSDTLKEPDDGGARST